MVSWESSRYSGGGISSYSPVVIATYKIIYIFFTEFTLILDAMHALLCSSSTVPPSDPFSTLKNWFVIMI